MSTYLHLTTLPNSNFVNYILNSLPFVREIQLPQDILHFSTI